MPPQIKPARPFNPPHTRPRPCSPTLDESQQMPQIPTALIDADALPRDRTRLDPAALTDLRLSIATHGLRTPIEVFATPDGYALISGLRRLTATRALHTLTGNPAYAQIEATLRTPATLTEALTLMVEENEVRADLSPWEKGRILVACCDQALFPTIDAAIQALHPNANASQRHRLRTLASVVEALEGALTQPETLSFRQMARLHAALRPDFAPVIMAALAEIPTASAPDQWQHLLPILDEAEAALRDPNPPNPGRPRRLLTPRKGLTIRRERTARGWTLHFSGPEATGMMMETVMDEVERMYGG